MPRSANTRGFPNPTYVTELGNRSAITHGGTYLAERGALSAAQSATIGNLTLSATAAAVAGATLAQTIAPVTLSAAGAVIVSASLNATLGAIILSATGAGNITASLSTTIGALTLAATGKVIVSAALDATIGALTLAATGAVIVSASLSATIDPITSSAEGRVIVGAAVDATIDNVTVSATGVVVPVTPPAITDRGGPAIYPWWWAAYVRRHEAERAARRDASAATGDGFAVLPMFVGYGKLEHDPDGDIEEIMGAILLLLDGEQAPAPVASPRTRQQRTLEITNVLPADPDADPEDDAEVLEIVAALLPVLTGA